jgi:hypothetical protein
MAANSRAFESRVSLMSVPFLPPNLAFADHPRPNRISLATEPAPVPLLAVLTQMTTTAVDQPADTLLAVTVIVIEAHPAVVTMTMSVDAMAVLLQELVLRLMTTRLLAAVASMILIVATTHPLTPMSMAMADLPTIVLHQETTRPGILVTPMTIAAVTSNYSLQAGSLYGLPLTSKTGCISETEMIRSLMKARGWRLSATGVQ